ncbi:replication initiation protein [Francisella philomiragia]|uniref:replication initiation protein n=1 Tax=Francisella philomiragia TaxID=28110 RepID=UPI003511C74D
MNDKNVVLSNKIVKGRYSFTKEEQNFIYNVISQISKDDEDFKVYKIDYKELVSLEKTSKNYKRFILFADSLVSKTIKIRDEKAKLTLICPWFSHISHYDNNPYIEASFDPKLKPYLLKLKKEFVQAKLPTLLSFKSKYSSRLYLLLKSDFDRQKKFKQNLFVNYDVESLINRFEMPKSMLTRYSKFKEFLLVTALKEVNNKTELNIQYKELKTGRKITTIQFCISKKEKTEQELIKEILSTQTKSDFIPEGLSNKTIQVLLDDELGFEKHDIKKIFDHYRIEDVESICEELWSSWDNAKIISRAGFIRGKLKNLNKKKTQNHNLFGFDEI